MKIVHQVQVPARTEQRSTTQCDLCGAPSGWFEKSDGAYQVAEVEIEMVTGARYPECDATTRTIVDCCTACFKAKVIPALVALGFTPREEESD